MCESRCVQELSEFFERDSMSRPSSCRSVVVNGEETPIRYWKDNVQELVNQYLMEFPNGVKRTYIYTNLSANFCYNTTLAGLCNSCDEFGYNIRATVTSLRDIKGRSFVTNSSWRANFPSRLKDIHQGWSSACNECNVACFAVFHFVCVHRCSVSLVFHGGTGPYSKFRK